MKIIIEDKQFIKELERLQYEVQARKNIVIYMLESNIQSENFQHYHDKYIEAFTAYEKKKAEVEPLFVKPANPKAKRWNLDFTTGELTID